MGAGRRGSTPGPKNIGSGSRPTFILFDQPALEATLADYLEEVDHVAARIVKLEKAITEGVRKAPQEMGAVIEALPCAAWRN